MRAVAFVLTLATLAAGPAIAQPVQKIEPPAGGGPVIQGKPGVYTQPGQTITPAIEAKARADASKLTPDQLKAEEARLKALQSAGRMAADQAAMLKTIQDMLARINAANKDAVKAIAK